MASCSWLSLELQWHQEGGTGATMQLGITQTRPRGQWPPWGMLQLIPQHPLFQVQTSPKDHGDPLK